MMRLRPVLGLALSAAACSTLSVEKVDLSARPPSNVAVYLTVDRRGEPVSGLTSDRFHLSEDGRNLPAQDSRQTLLDRRLVSEHAVLVLVDMSSAATSAKLVPQPDAAMEALQRRLSQELKVAIYAFDGAEDIVPIVPFPELAALTEKADKPEKPAKPARGRGGASAESLSELLTAEPTAETQGKSQPAGETPHLADFQQRDPSANLHGAVKSAVGELEDALARSGKPLRFGTLVVIAAGPDRANRVSRAKMLKAALRSKLDLFVVGLGPEIDKDELKDLGRTEARFELDSNGVRRALEAVGERIRARTRRHYLLSYCSPARRGKRVVRIEAVTPDGASGSLEARFSADGFRPRCDPNRPPDFTPPPEEAPEMGEGPAR